MEDGHEGSNGHAAGPPTTDGPNGDSILVSTSPKNLENITGDELEMDTDVKAQSEDVSLLQNGASSMKPDPISALFSSLEPDTDHKECESESKSENTADSELNVHRATDHENSNPVDANSEQKEPEAEKLTITNDTATDDTAQHTEEVTLNHGSAVKPDIEVSAPIVDRVTSNSSSEWDEQNLKL